MEREITKEKALSLFSESPNKLAIALGITCGAVSQWKPGELIPELQENKIKFILKPEEFKAA